MTAFLAFLSGFSIAAAVVFAELWRQGKKRIRQLELRAKFHEDEKLDVKWAQSTAQNTAAHLTSLCNFLCEGKRAYRLPVQVHNILADSRDAITEFQKLSCEFPRQNP